MALADFADDRFDVLVVGAGPAGSVAALVLARGGARVALVDKAGFPRDKACGDLVGPRGVRLLADLGVKVPGAVPVGDMLVVGPTGRRVRLPCRPGRAYPGHGLAVPRVALDAVVRDAALAAGAAPLVGHAVDVLRGRDGVEGVVLATGVRLRAAAVVGADGATSRVAQAAGLVDPARVLWGFAVRSYLAQPVDMPAIVLWEPQPWRALPGYGWLFPGPDGQANAGVGVGVLADRRRAADAVRHLRPFLDHLGRVGLLAGRPASEVEAGGGHRSGRLGGWLKMGMVGTTPAAGRVLLVGDAAGLVNPLQGEGISQAMRSGRAAASALLDADGRPGAAADIYRAWLRAEHLTYHGVAAAVQSALLPRPAAVGAVGRVLSLPGLGRAVAPGWSLFWNELVDGAGPGRGRATARLATHVGRAVTARSALRRSLEHTFRRRTTS